MVSNAIMWELTKNYNSFLVKRRHVGANMSFDPFNLTNEHCAKQAGISQEKALGVDLIFAKSKKNKAPKVLYNVVVKHRQHHVGKKAKTPNIRNRNTVAKDLKLKKGVQQAATVIQKMKGFRTDIHHDALRRIAKLHDLAVRRTAIKKIEKKPEEKKQK